MVEWGIYVVLCLVSYIPKKDFLNSVDKRDLNHNSVS